MEEKIKKQYSDFKDFVIIRLSLNNHENIIINCSSGNFFNMFGIDNYSIDSSNFKKLSKYNEKEKNYYFNKLANQNMDYCNYVSKLIDYTGLFDIHRLAFCVYENSKDSDLYMKLVFLDYYSNPIVLGLFKNKCSENYFSNETHCNIGFITNDIEANSLLTNKELAYPTGFVSKHFCCKLSKKEIQSRNNYIKSINKVYNSNLSLKKPDMLNSKRGVHKVLSK